MAVIGAGVGGLVCALDLLDADPQLRVVVLDKGAPGSAGSTPLAQGGMAAAVGVDDDPAAHAADTIAAGDGHTDPDAAAVLAAEAPQRVIDLLRRGVAFDRDDRGRLHLAREGGQRRARSVHVADATGAAIFEALRAAATGRVVRLQATAQALAISPAPGRAGSATEGGTGTEPRAVRGVWAWLDEVAHNPAGPPQRHGQALVAADAVVLATGGCGGLYAATTNRAGACADGLALAWRAGAELVDCEFVQFHPTGLRAGGRDGAAGAHDAADPCWRLLLTEALRGAGARLVDRHGRAFMPERHPDGDLAPRHVVARAILDQPGGAWLDARPVGAQRLAEAFPTVSAGARRVGYDLATEPVPVEPTEHYMVGGVATDLHAATTLAGLWAVGEVACTGVHGANRVAGNSLAEACVFAHRAAASIRRFLAAGRRRRPADPAPPPTPPGHDEATLAARRTALREAMSVGAGPLRTAEGLEGCGKALAQLADERGRAVPSRAACELDFALTAGRLIVRSAALREESRGAHVREDAPARSAAWAGVRLRQRDGEG